MGLEGLGGTAGSASFRISLGRLSTKFPERITDFPCSLSGIGQWGAWRCMSVEKYRLYARECFQIAENVNDPGTRTWLIKLSHSWLLLAQQAEKNLATDLVYETPLSQTDQVARPAMQQQQQIQPKKDEDGQNN